MNMIACAVPDLPALRSQIASFCIDDEPKIEHDEEQGEGSECVQVNQMLK